MKRALVLALVLGCYGVLHAQVAEKVEAQQLDQTAGITRLAGGVTLSTQENVQLKADEAEYNERTGELVLRGSVVLRQNLRPANQTVPATNLAGDAFPPAKEVVMRMTGGVQIVIGDMTVRADEADVNGLTGEMTLRGNVRASNAKWAGQKLFGR
jgi:lipopolysaccharide assembly outer membrane protein LptD (OstA)